MIEGAWLNSGEFAALAGIARRVATKALARAAEGQTWRGQRLEVRQARGKGGHSGTIYEVSLNSLQRALEGPLSTLPSAQEGAPRLTAASDQSSVVSCRFRAIEPALEHPRGSAERAAALRAAEAAGAGDLRTLQRWLADYERHGLAGLARKRPANAGRARVVISRPFDEAALAAGASRQTLENLGRAIEAKVKAIWQSRAEGGGWANVRRFAEFELLKLCEAQGLAIPPSALRLSRRYIEQFSAERIVNVWRNNRKAFEDGKPRINRDWTGLAPMERVVADVKHLDVVLTRPDGSEAWPKVIGFQDGGTGRVFLYPVLLPKGEGVRQEHVIEAFMTMAADPLWGFPQGLYLDNGSEFAIFERIRAALDLVSADAGRTIIYSKPYNASAKTIENAFRRLDRYLFSIMPGYVGGDRMNKKTQTVGKPPAPYPGTWDDFCATLRGLLINFNARPVGGQWGGRSADDWLREKQEGGWRPVLVDPLILDSAFCTTDLRKIDRGALRIGGERFHHPTLDGLPHGTPVEVAFPWRRGATPLFRPPGGAWAYVERDAPYPAAWKEGARDAGRRQRNYSRAVAQRARDTEAFDPVGASLDMAARYTPPTPAGRPDLLDGGGELRALADGRAKAAPAAAEGLSQEELNRRRRDRQTARLLKSQANVA